MKNSFKILILLLLITSCSDELSKSKAADIITECMEKHPNNGKLRINYGTIRLYKNKNLELMQGLQKEGFITMTLANKYSDSKFKITLTPKAEKLILKKGLDYNGYTPKAEVTLKTCDLKLNEVTEIQEIPAMNAARVKFTYQRINENALAKFEKGYPKIENGEIQMKKTTDGWKFCD